jgi:hypothetical protein
MKTPETEIRIIGKWDLKLQLSLLARPDRGASWAILSNETDDQANRGKLNGR